MTQPNETYYLEFNKMSTIRAKKYSHLELTT